MNLVFITSAIFVDEYLALLVCPAILFDLTFLTQVEGRSSQINISVFDQRTHAAEEEGQDQSGNVASVHIGIGHDDHLVVTQFAQVQFLWVVFGSDGHTHCAEDVLDFFAFEDLMVHCFFHIQDLTAKRQDCLEVTVASLLGCTASRVPFDEEQLAKGGVFGRTVCQLAGKTAACHR